MNQRIRSALLIYSAGALVLELLLLWTTYDNGGFHRNHTVAQLAIAIVVHVAAAVLWPVIVVVLLLQIAGVLPHQITLHF